MPSPATFEMSRFRGASPSGARTEIHAWHRGQRPTLLEPSDDGWVDNTTQDEQILTVSVSESSPQHGSFAKLKVAEVDMNSSRQTAHRGLPSKVDTSVPSMSVWCEIRDFCSCPDLSSFINLCLERAFWSFMSSPSVQQRFRLRMSISETLEGFGGLTIWDRWCCCSIACSRIQAASCCERGGAVSAMTRSTKDVVWAEVVSYSCWNATPSTQDTNDSCTSSTASQSPASFNVLLHAATSSSVLEPHGTKSK